MKPPESRTAATTGMTAAEDRAAKPDCHEQAVNAAQMGRWLDDAIQMSRRAVSDPVEHQRLGIWLQRMRRAVG